MSCTQSEDSHAAIICMVNEHPDHATIIRHDLSSLVIAAIICNDYRQEHQLEVEQRRAPSMCSEQRVRRTE